MMTAIPAVLSSLIPFSGNAATANTYGTDLPDLDRITVLLKAKEPLTWLFTGDSITAGVKHTHGYRSYPEVFGERIRWEMQRGRDVVINTGISGHTSRQILDDFEWRVAHLKPTVVSLMIGTNDCAGSKVSTTVFAQQLDELLQRIRNVGAIPILHTPNIIIEEKAPERSTLANYVTVIQQTAAKRKVVLVDNWAYWKDTLQHHTGVNIYRDWLNDPLHPNGNGHMQIAQQMFKRLAIFDPAASTCGAAYYEGEH